MISINNLLISTTTLYWNQILYTESIVIDKRVLFDNQPQTTAVFLCRLLPDQKANLIVDNITKEKRILHYQFFSLNSAVFFPHKLKKNNDMKIIAYGFRLFVFERPNNDTNSLSGVS